MSSIREIALAKAVGGGGSSVTVEELTVTENGTATAPSGKAYSPVNVAVPNTYSAGDEGKVVSDGALVAQTSRTVNANNTYDTTLNNEMVVNVQPPLQEKSVHANGDVTPDTGYYGLSKVRVDVAGGASAWNDPLSVNWDFKDPLNTRGNSSYTSGSATEVSTIDGWRIQQCAIELSNDGIILTHTDNNTGYFLQKFPNNVTQAFVANGQFTFSVIVDGVLYSKTDSFPTSANTGTFGFRAGGLYVRVWRYSSTYNTSALTIDLPVSEESHVIQAVKLEPGSSQTLATLVDGVYVLNNTMNKVTEDIMVKSGFVLN